jgi:hypothetical protein
LRLGECRAAGGAHPRTLYRDRLRLSKLILWLCEDLRLLIALGNWLIIIKKFWLEPPDQAIPTG